MPLLNPKTPSPEVSETGRKVLAESLVPLTLLKLQSYFRCHDYIISFLSFFVNRQLVKIRLRKVLTIARFLGILSPD